MKDFLGNELYVGDTVIFMKKNYRDLQIGKILSVSNKMIEIEDSKRSFKNTTRQFGTQVIKHLSHVGEVVTGS